MQTPAAGWLAQAVPQEPRRCVGTGRGDAGKHLRSLPKEFLPSKQFCSLTGIPVRLLVGRWLRFSTLGFYRCAAERFFPEVSLERVGHQNTGAGPVTFIFSIFVFPRC